MDMQAAIDLNSTDEISFQPGQQTRVSARNAARPMSAGGAAPRRPDSAPAGRVVGVPVEMSIGLDQGCAAVQTSTPHCHFLYCPSRTIYSLLDKPYARLKFSISPL